MILSVEHYPSNAVLGKHGAELEVKNLCACANPDNLQEARGGAFIAQVV
jgi:hypothetical protein